VNRKTVVALLIAMGSLVFSSFLVGATLQDFGYGKMTYPVVPLLIVTAEYAGLPPLTHTNAEYDSLVFNPFNAPNVNGFFLENSKGQFFWQRAAQGIYGPVQLPAAVGQETNDNKRPARVIEAVMARGFDFAQFDKNGDKTVDIGELAVLIIENYPSGARRSTDPPCIKTGSSSVQVCATPLLVGDRPSLFLIAHELSHFLGTLDLYGRWGIDALHNRISLMGPLVGGADGRESVHLDAWHKLQLGWVEPQIYSINSPAIPVLAAANTTFRDSAIILYDPARGTGEYFLLEYRAANQQGFHYDRDTSGNGLAIWHIQQDGNKNPMSVPNLLGNNVTYLGVFSEGAPALVRTGTQLWGSDATTQRLQWLDGTSTNTCLHVRPFTAGDSTMVLDIFQQQGTSPCVAPGRVVYPTPPIPNPCQMLRNMINAQTAVIALLGKQLARATSPAEIARLQSQIDTEQTQLDGLYEDLRARGCSRR